MEIPDVAVPDAEHTEHHRDVLGERRVAEMLVHAPRSGEEGAEVFAADGDGERQSDGGPDGIAAADPIPESKDPIRLDAELGDLRQVAGDGGEMVPDGLLTQPVD